MISNYKPNDNLCRSFLFLVLQYQKDNLFSPKWMKIFLLTTTVTRYSCTLTCSCTTQKLCPYATLSFILEELSVFLLCPGRKTKLIAELSWDILIYTYKVNLTGTNIAYVDDTVLCSLSSPLPGEQNRRIQILKKKGHRIVKITYNKWAHKIGFHFCSYKTRSACCDAAHEVYRRWTPSSLPCRSSGASPARPRRQRCASATWRARAARRARRSHRPPLRVSRRSGERGSTGRSSVPFHRPLQRAYNSSLILHSAIVILLLSLSTSTSLENPELQWSGQRWKFTHLSNT